MRFAITRTHTTKKSDMTATPAATSNKPLTFEEAVRSYKYSSPNLSLFEQLFLVKWWNYFVQVYPMWLAPNVISTSGLFFCLALYHISWYFSPSGLGEADPQVIYLLLAWLLFCYQTADGTDGAQARRTGSGSACGERVDHVIDGAILNFVAFAATDAVGLGIDRPVVWSTMIGGQVAFYLSNMTLLHRGKQMFFAIDIMELQWVLIITFAISGVFGAKVWAETWLPIPHESMVPAVHFVAKMLDVSDFVAGNKFQPRLIIAFGSVWGMFQNILIYTYMSSSPYFTNKKLDHPGCGVFQLVRQFVIIAVYAALAVSCVVFVSKIESKEDRHSAFRALLMMLSFAFAELMDRLLVMRVSHYMFPTFSPTLVEVALFAVFALYKVQFAFWPMAFIALASQLVFFTWMSQRLLKILGISMFTIKYKKEEVKKQQ